MSCLREEPFPHERMSQPMRVAVRLGRDPDHAPAGAGFASGDRPAQAANEKPLLMEESSGGALPQERMCRVGLRHCGMVSTKSQNRKVPGATSNRRLRPECRWFRTVAAALYPFDHSVAMIGSAGWGLDQRAISARLGTSSAEGSVPSRPHSADRSSKEAATAWACSAWCGRECIAAQAI